MRSSPSVNDAAIRPPLVRWHEFLGYRDFFALLVWREIHLRYKHTLIGIGWALLNPLLTMAVFGLIVPNLMERQTLTALTGGVPYALYVYCGVVPWTCFANAVIRANTSLVDQGPLLKNMYFPRLALPLAKVLATHVELLIALTVLLFLVAAFGLLSPWRLLLLPAFVAPLLMAAAGAGLALAILQVRYRDVFFLSQFAVQLGLLVTPVWFPLGALPQSIRWVIALNPMTAVVEGFRWSLLGVDAPSAGVVALSALSSGSLLLIGLHLFRTRHETVSDYV
jgi:lipopolysaccharide transport system permease protein